ncbi:MAG TPA: cytochrome P450 [Egibacteraceae bacterium]|nr:cytochrome P450 [Egibacteraceae bacterium]
MTPAASVPKATLADTMALATDVLIPFAARGPIARRPRITTLSERMDADRRAVRRMQRVRDRYGPGPVLLKFPRRDLAMVLASQHVHRILNGSPDPFATANLEKRQALSHFQPHGVLISEPAERADRRPFNEEVLDNPNPIHHMAADFIPKIRQEADVLVRHARNAGRLTWDDFIVAWWRTVRRVYLGDGARDDHALTDMLTELRHDANFSYLKPKRKGLNERFLRQLQGHLDRAEPGSLAALIAQAPTTHVTKPAQQVPQWLFASDPAGIAAIRALALLVAHPEQLERVRADLDGRDLDTPQDLPLLRCAVLESLRLWPTTPAILRDTTTQTRWETGILPAAAGLVIFAPLFHRDDRTLPYANSFAPDIWLEDRTDKDWPLVPFSGGPGMCPGRNLVLLTTTTMLASLVAALPLHLDPPDALLEGEPLPGTYSPYNLVFSTS